MKLKSKKQTYTFLIFTITSIIIGYLFLPNFSILQIENSSRKLDYYLEPSTPNILQDEIPLNYTMEVSYKIRSISQTAFHRVILARFPQNRNQDVYLKSIEMTGVDYFYQEEDKYGNTFDIIDGIIKRGNVMSINYKYNISLKNPSIQIFNENNIKLYNRSQKIFSLYCNQSEIFYEIDDPDLIIASNKITGNLNNPIEKAKAIIEWIYNNIEYDDSIDVRKGASWAYDNKRGICGDFSDLFITLLRIQGIPARKLNGFVLISKHFKSDGRIVELKYTKDNSNFALHAWAEYYVEGIGWLSCDPTWYSPYNTPYDYFYKMAYIHINEVRGRSFSSPLHAIFLDNFEFLYTIRLIDPGYIEPPFSLVENIPWIFFIILILLGGYLYNFKLRD